MQFIALAILAGVLALLSLGLGARVLWKGPWLLAWLRGCMGTGLIAVAILLGLLGYDLSTYHERTSDTAVAVVSIRAGSNGLYQITLIEGEHSRQFLLDGEQWGLDVRLLDWKGLAQLIGLQPGYRLESMQGRYLTLEQQTAALYPQQMLGKSLLGIDAWQWVHSLLPNNSWLNTRREGVQYVPLHDGARYELNWLPTGLQARPLNDIAEQELQHWVD